MDLAIRRHCHRHHIPLGGTTGLGVMAQVGIKYSLNFKGYSCLVAFILPQMHVSSNP
jgi:hypothetical protein